VVNWNEFTGRTEAVQLVNVTARGSAVTLSICPLGQAICSAFLQRSEEGQQGIASLESGDGFAGRG
jgi:hypothetical protein